MVDLAQEQDRTVGDGTTSVVIIASRELLKRANELVKNRIHPTTIITGFRLALKEAICFINEVLSINVESLGRDTLVNIAKTSMSSKVIGSDSEFFSNVVVRRPAGRQDYNSKGENQISS